MKNEILCDRLKKSIVCDIFQIKEYYGIGNRFAPDNFESYMEFLMEISEYEVEILNIIHNFYYRDLIYEDDVYCLKVFVYDKVKELYKNLEEFL